MTRFPRCLSLSLCVLALLGVSLPLAGYADEPERLTLDWMLSREGREMTEKAESELARVKKPPARRSS